MKQWYKTVWLVIVLWVLGITQAQAEAPHPPFERISLEDGLSHGTVFSIVQDDVGYLWFGAQSGLNRYDGQEVKVFRHNSNDPTSISSDNAGNLYLDSAGFIWIGTWGGGLNKFDPRTEQATRYLPNPDDSTSISSDRVQTMFEDSTKRFWVGTAGQGLNLLNRDTGEFSIYQYDPDNTNSISHNRIWSIVEDTTGWLWIATSDGLTRFNPNTETFTRYYHDPDDPHSLSHSLIRTLYLDKTNTLWVGTEEGLNRYNPNTDTFTRYLPNANTPQTISDSIINTITEDQFGNLWIGTTRGGLNKFNREMEIFTTYMNDPDDNKSLSYNDVRFILLDQAGVLWVATRGGGVNKFIPALERFKYITSGNDNLNGLNNNDVRAIYLDDEENLWLGTKGGGLNQYNPQTGQFTHYSYNPDDETSLGHDEVFAIFEDRAGNFWIGTGGEGLNKFDRETETFIRYPPNKDDPNSIQSGDVNSIYEDDQGYLWIGTKGGGLARFDPKTEMFHHYQHNPDDPNSLGNDDVYQLDGNGNILWISTYGGGLNRLDMATDEITRYRHDPSNPSSISNNDVYAIHRDEAGYLWVGTANGGLNKFDLVSETFVRFTPEDGLLSNTVYNIIKGDDGNLWISTSKGLSKLNPKTETFINYDTSDGIESLGYNPGAAFTSKTGTLYFGGINGVLYFDPKNIIENRQPPETILTELILPNEKLTEQLHGLEQLTLPYQDNIVTFGFAALDYTNPTKNNYLYMLEGFDKDWVEAGNRQFATYTNLNPGSYRFQVKGSNNASVWDEEAVTISLIIQPPFWQTWWFRLTALLSMILLVYGSYRFRVRQIEAHRKMLEHEVEERTVELSVANKHLQTLNNQFHSELQMAREIQHTLLPAPQPNWSQLEVHCYTTAAHEVGGDFYVYHAFEDKTNNRRAITDPALPVATNRQIILANLEPQVSKYAIAVGDVSGKGMPAALLMAVSLASFRSLVAPGLSPAQLLAKLDKALLPYTHTRQQNCALCYTEISLPPPNNGNGPTLRTANAGCIPPIISHQDGQTTWLEVGGMPLGVGLGSRTGYAEQTVALTPGDLVIMLSDGVIEAMNSTHEMFGFDRVERAVQTAPPGNAEAMLMYLKEAVYAFTGEAEQHDDLTIVVIQV